MAGRPMPFRNPAGHAGLRQNLISFAASLTQFFHRTPFAWFGPAFHAAID